MEALKISTYIFKKNNEWRLRVLKHHFNVPTRVKIPFVGTLDKNTSDIYSILSEFNIDPKTLDDKFYTYRIESDDTYIYCYGISENCVRAGIIEYMKMIFTNQNITFTLCMDCRVIFDKSSTEEETLVNCGGMFEIIGDY